MTADNDWISAALEVAPPCSGSFTHVIEPEQYTEFFGGPSRPTGYTITVIRHEKWWKRPLLWLLRKPTKHVVVYDDAQFVDITYGVDGGASVEFSGNERS